MRLRYIGALPEVSLPGLGISVEPGGEFEAPAEVAARYAGRSDFEPAAPPKGARAARKAEPAPDAAAQAAAGDGN